MSMERWANKMSLFFIKYYGKNRGEKKVIILFHAFTVKKKDLSGLSIKQIKSVCFTRIYYLSLST